MTTPGLMSIGMFSRATLLSVKQLRRYHEQGVLVPAAIDPATGYRLYDAAQVHDAAVLTRLRDLDLPLVSVARVLEARDPEVTREILAEHEAVLRERRAGLECAIVALQDTTAPVANTPIHLREFDAIDVLEIASDVEHDRLPEFLNAAYTELEECAAAAGLTVTGPSLAEYPSQVAEVERVAALIPVSGPGTVTGRVRNRRLDRARCAVAVHHGSYERFDETYGQLGAWVARNATDARGSIIERYLVDPCAAATPADLRTEIWWPVEAAPTKEN
ncbi:MULTISPECIES: MerR family transcriptional regulator [Tsukamurella]|uniref:MerR family transcriptional regulator n=1 Tax=Tsukamurella columbiensis TaxID=128509 RepID=A0ABX1LFR9_9ACTN|nr:MULTISPECIES: MerR family transcriptional regulator [Tsukamurella]NMD55838.1 MerR family transcriptional regulator [Tsukamurella columbiensis]